MDNKLIITEASADLKPLISSIATGSDKGLEKQLIEKSRQPNILKYTPNDAARRFGSQTMMDKWRAAGREVHWLLGADNDLAGIIWYGKKALSLEMELPETPEETLAIRLYDGYTGHGLAVPFMRQSLAIHVKSQHASGENVAGLWLQTDTDNQAAIATYRKFGFHEVPGGGPRVTMIMPATEIIGLVGL